LEIILYCEPLCVVFWEQYHIDFFKPEYNLLLIAGSRLGLKYSEETRAKMSALSAKKGRNKPMFGRTHSEESKAKLSASQP